jgi:hypothetical protein
VTGPSSAELLVSDLVVRSKPVTQLPKMSRLTVCSAAPEFRTTTTTLPAPFW